MHHLMWIGLVSHPVLIVGHLKRKTSVESKIHTSVANNRAKTSKEKPYLQYRPNVS